MPDELAAQLPITKQVLDALGIVRCEKAGYEADDLLGTISRRADEHGDTCVVVTGDRDSTCSWSAAARPSVLVSTRMGQTTYRTYDTAAFREKYGFDPIRLIDLKALMGDSSDNIQACPASVKRPPCSCCDFRHARRRVRAYRGRAHQKGARTKLQNGEQSAKDSYWLATIDRNVPLDLDVEHLPAQDIDETALYDLLTRLEFKNFIKRFDLSGESVSARVCRS